jgi:hypothetical protein
VKRAESSLRDQTRQSEGLAPATAVYGRLARRLGMTGSRSPVKSIAGLRRQSTSIPNGFWHGPNV